MGSRKQISKSTRDAVLVEAGYRCAVPTCRTILAIDLHHIVHVSDGGGNEESNLLALCPNCHALHHRGEITQEAIRVWKGVLVSLNLGFDRDVKDKLLFLAVDGTPKHYSSEGVLFFSGLISSGLAACGPEQMGLHPRGQGADRSKSRWSVALTQRGKLLVDAWANGDAKSLEAALATEPGPHLN